MHSSRQCFNLLATEFFLRRQSAVISESWLAAELLKPIDFALDAGNVRARTRSCCNCPDAARAAEPVA